MQTLGISNSPIKSEGRIKSLLWPSVQTSNDVDYLGAQGYWICAAIAVLSFVMSAIGAHPVSGLIVAIFYSLEASACENEVATPQRLFWFYMPPIR